jgi:hypothetical protein
MPTDVTSLHHVRVALARHDRANDGHAGQACDVGDDMIQLQVHLHHRLLHVLDMRRRIVQRPLSLPQIGAQSGYFGVSSGYVFMPHEA